jgi:hypothetical protein
MRRVTAGLRLMAGIATVSALMTAASNAQTAASGNLVTMQANAANMVMPAMTYDNRDIPVAAGHRRAR